MITNKEELLDQALTQLLNLGFSDFDDVEILDTLSAERVMAIGTTIDELLFTRLSVKEMIQRQKEQSRGMNMHYSQSELFRHVSPTGRSALIVSDLRVSLVIHGQNIELYVRFSTVFEWQDGRWTIVHFHASKPDNVESEKDTFGIEEWKQKAIELEKMVSERTAELVMKNQELSNTISQLKSTQAQLIQSEKMASLGELTAGIAHEIQNPLNFVNNFSEVNTELIEELKSERQKANRLRQQASSVEDGERQEEIEKALLDDIIQNLEKISFHGKRADGIVKSMLQHSRASTGQKELTDINALADEYLRLAYHGYLAKEKSFNVKFKTDFDPSLPKLNVVPQDIGRVLLNLINNAFYACMERQNGGPTSRKASSVEDGERQTANGDKQSSVLSLPESRREAGPQSSASSQQLVATPELRSPPKISAIKLRSASKTMAMVSLRISLTKSFSRFSRQNRQVRERDWDCLSLMTLSKRMVEN